MIDQNNGHGYVAPEIKDFGSLQELTAACADGSGGDAYTTANHLPPGGYGVSNPAYGCTSK